MEKFKTVATGLTHKRIPIYKTKVNYGNLTRLSHRRRKESMCGGEHLPCLECGNAAIVMKFIPDYRLHWTLEEWWKDRNNEVENFNVELIQGDSGMELRIMTKECYYTSSKKEYNTILKDIQGNVLKYLNSVPEWITGSCEMIVLSDWDMLVYVEEFKEVV